MTDTTQKHLIDRLRSVMRDISEDCYCAGWLDSLEYDLWRIVKGGDRRFGMGGLSDEDVATLKDLSELTGGWMRYEGFVPLAEWEKDYAEHEERANAREASYRAMVNAKPWKVQPWSILPDAGIFEIVTVDGDWVRGGGILDSGTREAYAQEVSAHNAGLLQSMPEKAEVQP